MMYTSKQSAAGNYCYTKVTHFYCYTLFSSTFIHRRKTQFSKVVFLTPFPFSIAFRNVKEIPWTILLLLLLINSLREGGPVFRRVKKINKK